MRNTMLKYLTFIAALSACSADKATGPSTSRTLQPCSASGTMQVAVLQGATVPCTAGGTFDLAAGGAHYLVIPQFAAGNVANKTVDYSIGVAAAGTTASIVSPVSPSVQLISGGQYGSSTPQLAFDFALRTAERSALASGAWKVDRTAPAISARLLAAPPPIGSLRTFRVISSINVQNPTYKTVTASLSYAGQNVLIYIDTLAPANGFTPDQLNAFGQLFDQTLYPIDSAAFGSPSDIDQTGAVIMLLSPVVNALTPSAQCATQGFIAGFFDGFDLVSASANSNKGEVFYGVVPDPSGASSCAHSVSQLLRVEAPTFLHELQHLISFSQHVVVHGGQEEEGWLDEGMSLVAEELGSVYYEQRFPPPTGRTNPSQLFPDSSQGFIGDLLSGSYAYLLKTDTATVTLHSDSDGGLAWRGGDWLLLRWLGDQKGADIYRRLEHGTTIGVANIEAAAGEPFPGLFGDFSTSLWTDSIVGVPKSSIPPRDRFSTRTLRVLYQAYYNSVGPSSQVPRPYPVQLTALPSANTVSASMVPGTMSFYRLDTATGETSVRLQFSTPTTGSFASNLHAQVSVFRLPQ